MFKIDRLYSHSRYTLVKNVLQSVESIRGNTISWYSFVYRSDNIQKCRILFAMQIHLGFAIYKNHITCW